jgi:hypothetical protein
MMLVNSSIASVAGAASIFKSVAEKTANALSWCSSQVPGNTAIPERSLSNLQTHQSPRTLAVKATDVMQKHLECVLTQYRQGIVIMQDTIRCLDQEYEGYVAEHASDGTLEAAAAEYNRLVPDNVGWAGDMMPGSDVGSRGCGVTAIVGATQTRDNFSNNQR